MTRLAATPLHHEHAAIAPLVVAVVATWAGRLGVALLGLVGAFAIAFAVAVRRRSSDA